MFDFIFSMYRAIIRAILRATSAPVVANFMLPPLRGRIVGKDADQDIPMIMLGSYKVWGYSSDGMVLQTSDYQIFIDSTGMPEHVWFGVVDWILARQSQ